MSPTRVLFVDDEKNILLTLGSILRRKGFEVRTAATVTEALAEIQSHSFNVLISDLNIGQPSDGFTVVSAMRRTQPDCVNFILTGYPAFESALQALRLHVDEYLIKPVEVELLLGTIEDKLASREPNRPFKPKSISMVLREELNRIQDQVLSRMKLNSAINGIAMSDKERIDHLPLMLTEIASQLESSGADEPSPNLLQSGREHGEQRWKLGYTAGMLIADAAILDSTVYEVIQGHLLHLDLSNLITDLSGFNQSLQEQLQQSVEAFTEMEHKHHK